MGARGVGEMRDSAAQVSLSGYSPEVWSLTLDQAKTWNHMARALMLTTSLSEAESVVAAITKRPSEIEMERTKAATLPPPRPLRLGELDAALDRLPDLAREAASRGTRYLTVRRLLDSLALPPAALPELRAALRRLQGERDLAPVWRVPALHEGPD
jgi:hypothetical protein